jgi:hypothetical protein
MAKRCRLRRNPKGIVPTEFAGPQHSITPPLQHSEYLIEPVKLQNSAFPGVRGKGMTSLSMRGEILIEQG